MGFGTTTRYITLSSVLGTLTLTLAADATPSNPSGYSYLARQVTPALSGVAITGAFIRNTTNGRSYRLYLRIANTVVTFQAFTGTGGSITVSFAIAQNLSAGTAYEIRVADQTASSVAASANSDFGGSDSNLTIGSTIANFTSDGSGASRPVDNAVCPNIGVLYTKS